MTKGRWETLKGSHRMGAVEICWEISAPLPFINPFRMRLLSSNSNYISVIVPLIFYCRDINAVDIEEITNFTVLPDKFHVGHV